MNFTDMKTVLSMMHNSDPYDEEKRPGQCEILECDETANHISPDDGAQLCDICWEIECDVL